MATKKDYLRQTDSLNRRSSKVRSPLFSENAFFDPCDLIQVKYEMLRRVSHDGKSITETTKEFGFSRPSFYETREALVQKGLPGLVPMKKGPRRAHKLNETLMKYVLTQSEEGLKSVELSKAVEKKFGIKVHPRSIERAISKQKKNQITASSGNKRRKLD